MDIEHLQKHAVGLNLNDPEDRAIFRGKVRDSVKNTKMSAINEWIDANHRNRNDAVRELANAYIKHKANINPTKDIPHKSKGGVICW